MKVRLILLFIILSVVPAVLAQKQDPAEKRAREFVAQINNSNRTQFTEYVKANFGGDFLNLPISAHLNFFLSIKDASRGFEILDVAQREENRVTLRLKSKLTGELNGLSIRVDPKPPHKILGIGMREVAGDNPDSRKLSAEEIGADLENYVKKLAGADVFSGSVLLAKGDQVVFKGAFGTANKDFGSKNRIDTKFNLGSMNKMFTALSIAKLVETGKLTVNDPLSKFVPDFPNSEAAKKIKIKHLLSHTAGLGGYFSQSWQMQSRGSIRTVDDMMAVVKKDEKELRFEPGTSWRYSNTGMLVLGKVIEVASGKSYFEFVDENILRPSGMKNTGCFELDRVNENLAVGYDKVFGDKEVSFENNIFLHVMRGGPQGGCYSTAEDLHRFATALIGGKIVRKDLADEFTTAKPDMSSAGYGYGFSLSEDGNIFGHGGGFTGISANLDIFRDSGWIAIVLSNYSRASQPVSSKMRRLVSAAASDGENE